MYDAMIVFIIVVAIVSLFAQAIFKCDCVKFDLIQLYTMGNKAILVFLFSHSTKTTSSNTTSYHRNCSFRYQFQFRVKCAHEVSAEKPRKVNQARFQSTRMFADGRSRVSWKGTMYFFLCLYCYLGMDLV